MATQDVSSELRALAEKAKDYLAFSSTDLVSCADGLRGLGDTLSMDRDERLGGAVKILGDRVGGLAEDVDDILMELVKLVLGAEQ